MHFEILVEDISGQKALNIIVPKIIGEHNTFNIHPYKGIGHIPKNLISKNDPQKRILLDQLPRLLKGYGKTFANYPPDYKVAVIFVCDLDNKCLKLFKAELSAILNECDPKPNTYFCIAVEEGEAWFLGDLPAIKSAYPKAKDIVLNAYVNDEICGTWEYLANAIYPGGAAALSAKGWQSVGSEKSQWAVRISPYMNVTENSSPSFIYFRKKLLELST